MSDKTGIAWTESTWNPTTGCSKVSQGCKFCYALRDWPRLAAPRPKPNVYTGREFTDVKFHPERLKQPINWTKPRRIFVNSMSDLFHEGVPSEFIAQVFAVMAQARQHTFQVLTKRPERMRALLNDPVIEDCITEYWREHDQDRETWQLMFPLPNVWLGVSVEDQATADERIPLLLQTPAAVRFVSYEPALGRVNFQKWFAANHLHHIDGGPKLDWVIVGGESGPKARPCDVAWIRSTVEQCKAAGTAVFVKQLGARPVDSVIRWIDPANQSLGTVSDRKGGDPAEWPEDLRVQEYPNQGVES